MKYTNVCLDGEIQQNRLEAESNSRGIYAEMVRNSKAS